MARGALGSNAFASDVFASHVFRPTVVVVVTAGGGGTAGSGQLGGGPKPFVFLLDPHQRRLAQIQGWDDELVRILVAAGVLR